MGPVRGPIRGVSREVLRGVRFRGSDGSILGSPEGVPDFMPEPQKWSALRKTGPKIEAQSTIFLGPKSLIGPSPKNWDFGTLETAREQCTYCATGPGHPVEHPIWGQRGLKGDARRGRFSPRVPHRTPNSYPVRGRIWGPLGGLPGGSPRRVPGVVSGGGPQGGLRRGSPGGVPGRVWRL